MEKKKSPCRQTGLGYLPFPLKRKMFFCIAFQLIS